MAVFVWLQLDPLGNKQANGAFISSVHRRFGIFVFRIIMFVPPLRPQRWNDIVSCRRGHEAGAGSRLRKALDVEEFRTHAHQMVDFIADYHRDIESFPVRSQVKVISEYLLLIESFAR